MDKKDQRRAMRAIEKIAEREGKTVFDVREEMAQAIEVGWNSQDPQARRYWIRVSKGMKPSVEEFILFLSEEAKKKRLH